MSGLTYIQAIYGRAAGTSQALTLGSNTTSGSLLLCLAVSEGSYTYGTAGDVSDPHNGNWNFISGSAISTHGYAGIFWVKNTYVGSLVVTVKGASVTAPTICEFTGQGASPIDAFAINGALLQSISGSGGYYFPAIASNGVNETIVLLGADVAVVNGVSNFIGNAAFAGNYYYGPNEAGRVISGFFASATSFNGTANGLQQNNATGSYQGVVAALSIVLVAVATSTFSPVAGSYTGTQSVTVSNANSGLSGFAMYYTTDGSTPTTSSTLYTGAISVSSSLTLRVLATATGYANSAIASAAYTITSTPGGSTSSGMGFGTDISATSAIETGGTTIVSPKTAVLTTKWGPRIIG